MKSPKIIILSLGTRGASPSFTYSISEELHESNVKFKTILSTKSDLKNIFASSSFNSSSVSFLSDIPNHSRNVFNIYLFAKFFLRCFSSCSDPRRGTVVIHPFFHPWSFVFAIFTIFRFRHWIVLHDASPHDGDFKPFWHMINFIICNFFNKIILLSPYQSTLAYKYCFNKSRSGVHVLHHPSFRHYKHIKSSCSRKNVPAELEKLKHLSNVDFLFFGRIEKYKGMPLLLSAFNYYRCNINPDARLLVVGRVAPNASFDSKFDGVIFINTFLDDQFIPFLFSLARVVCFPYLSATQSGVLQLAFDMNKNVVCTPLSIFMYQASINKPHSVFSEDFTPHSFAAAMYRAHSLQLETDQSHYVYSGLSDLLV